MPYHHRGFPHASPYSSEPSPVPTFHEFHLKDEVVPPSGLVVIMRGGTIC